MSRKYSHNFDRDRQINEVLPNSASFENESETGGLKTNNYLEGTQFFIDGLVDGGKKENRKSI